MPNIDIRETEADVLSIVSPTDSLVVVPVICSSILGKSTKIYKPGQQKDFYTDYHIDTVKQSNTGGLSPNNHVESSFSFVIALLDAGLNVVVKPLPVTGQAKEVYDEDDLVTIVNAAVIGDAFKEFESKNLYNIKFITTGSHANMILQSSSESTITTGCYDKLITIAANRGSDCVALVEIGAPDNERAIIDKDHIADTLRTVTAIGEVGQAAACFYPRGIYSTLLDQDGSTQYTDLMPACFGYLKAFANSCQTNSDWLAAAGVVRGTIPSLVSPKEEIGESLMHVLLNESTTSIPFCVNPIMKVSEYGTKVWGNRVALPKTSRDLYKSFLNIRILIADIKKQIYDSATRVTFEPNDKITWLNFKGLVNTLLDDMVANRGIEWYSWRRQATDKKATIKAVLTIKPIEAVEYFDIEVNLTTAEGNTTATAEEI